MAFRYQKGQIVYWHGEKFPLLAGIYTVEEVNTTGEFYRIEDSKVEFTDVSEDEIKAVDYHLFVSIPTGLPIIIPEYLPQYKDMHDKIHAYEHVLQGTPRECIDKQIEILTRIHLIPK